NRFAGLMRNDHPDLPSADPLMRPLSASLLLCVLPAFGFLSLRVKSSVSTIGDRLLWLSLIIFEALLMFLDQTKAPLYALVLPPGLCVLVAVAGARVFRWLQTARANLPFRFVVSTLFIALFLIQLQEGL